MRRLIPGYSDSRIHESGVIHSHEEEDLRSWVVSAEHWHTSLSEEIRREKMVILLICF